MIKYKLQPFLLFLLIFVTGVLAVWAQDASIAQAGGREPQSEQISAPIYFQLGKSVIAPEFMGNRERLEAFVCSLQKILADSNYVVNRVRVAGMASPDGARERNEELASQRANTLAAYLLERTNITPDKLDIVNGGENWSGLRAMIKASDDVPDKAKILEFMSRDDDRDVMKRNIQYYNGSRAWKYMYEHFFPTLRMGAGGTDMGSGMNSLVRENWRRTARLIEESSLPEQTKKQLQQIIDTEENPSERARLIKESCPAEFYTQLQQQLASGLLNTPGNLSTDNWSLLRARIKADTDIPNRDEVLRIIDNAALLQEREQQLRELDRGVSYRYIQDHFFPELLLASAPATPESYSGADDPVSTQTTTLSEENWKRLRAMVETSTMPYKSEVLALIDTLPDAVERIRQLQELGDGQPYIYMTEVFFPELLYGVSPAAMESWNQLTILLEHADLANKDAILEIIRTTPPGLEREQAIRALDNGESWEKIGELLLPGLLCDTEEVTLSGSGVSFSYELSPAARAREAEAQRRIRVEEAERRMKEQTAAKEEVRRQEAERLVREQAERKAARQTVQRRRRLPALFALKTDFVLWGSVMPGFEMGAFTPNLSAEFYFAKRWSIQLGGAYSNWDALSGGKGLFAVTGVEFEPRYWVRNDGLFRGFYTGVYGIFGDFDVQDKATSGATGSYLTGGASAGWAQVLGRHLYLELGLRLGYRSAKSDLYEILREHCYYNSSRSEGKFAPQVRFQLVYRFGKSGR